MYLLDTNIISEYRKRNNANSGVRRFFHAVDVDSLFLPVQVIGEIRAGIAKLYRNGAPDELEKAKIYEKWLDDDLLKSYGNRIVEFDKESAQLWGMLLAGQKKDPHTIDKQIAAMALTRDMTVVTRDKGEAFVKIPSLKTFNPFVYMPSVDDSGIYS